MKTTETKTIQKLKKELEAANRTIANQSATIRGLEQSIEHKDWTVKHHKQWLEDTQKDRDFLRDRYMESIGMPTAKSSTPSHLTVIKTIN